MPSRWQLRNSGEFKYQDTPNNSPRPQVDGSTRPQVDQNVPPSADQTSFRVPEKIQMLLAARGFSDPESWGDLFEPKLSQMKSPNSLLGMKSAIERLILAYDRQEKICLYGDFDMDGTSGLALAMDGFKALGFEQIVPIQPRRLTDGYGFHGFIVEELHKQGVTLIMTIDVGITAVEAVDVANSLGVDVIITDHHQPGPELPKAFSVINPNQGTCPSGLTYLCGAGVAFTVLRALKRGLADQGKVPESALNLKLLLDCLTIATLTDMVPLVDDNRLLVKHGLKVLEGTQRPGLRALLEKLNLSGRELTAQDVAIRFAPKLNALSRLETGLRPLDIYMAPTLEIAYELVDQVMSQNSDRLDLQGQGEAEAFEMLADWPHKDFVLLVSKNFHRGVIGLIATKIANEVGRPTFIGAEGDDGVIVGSARTPQGKNVSVLEGLRSAESLLHRFGGHPPAAGFEFHRDQKDNLIQALAAHHANLDYNQELVLDYDFNLKLADLTPGFLRWMDLLGPFGVDFAVPIFGFENLILESIIPLRGGHQKWILKEIGSDAKVDALYFSPPQGLSVAKGSLISVLGEVQKNTYKNTTKPQILIKDYKMATDADRSVSSSKGADEGEIRRSIERGP